jgi:ParB family chromosome partitioning protein
MNEDNSKRRLGRGLAALIGEMDQIPAAEIGAAPAVNPDRLVPSEFVGRNPRTPRLR